MWGKKIIECSKHKQTDTKEQKKRDEKYFCLKDPLLNVLNYTCRYTLKTNALAQQQNLTQQFASIFFEL